MASTPVRPQVVVTNRVFPETRALLTTHADVVMNAAETPWPAADVCARCREADALLAFMTDQVDAAFIAACPRLKIIGAALKGYDNIDVAAAERAGVWVTIVPDLLTVPTAELAVGLMLALGRHILAGDRTIRTHGFNGWRPTLYGRGLAGTTVGIVGFGRVGRAIAARLTGFDAAIIACDPAADRLPTSAGAAADAPASGAVRMMPFADLLATADIVVLAAPLTPATHHLIDRAALAAMKPGALLINPARGSLVDESAVADAIDTGRLGGYAADVFACEDWAQADRPAGIDPRLLQTGAPTVLTPHIGSAVVDVRREIELSAARSILQALSGAVPSGAVNAPERPRPC